MPNSAIITRKQLQTLYISTELGGKVGDSRHFSYAGLGNSTYSFGTLQFDVGNGDHVKSFLINNGFDADDIRDLSRHGGLSPTRLEELNTKLMAIPQSKLEQFTAPHACVHG